MVYQQTLEYLGQPLLTFTQKSDISLDLQDCYIGEALIMKAGNISINGLLGKSKQSKIILDNVSTMFDMTLRGDISIDHGHTYFKMSGIFLDKNYLNPQYSNILTRNNVIEYHITLTNLIQVLDSCNISHTREDINVLFTHSMVDYSWRTKNVSDTLHIYDKDSQTYIKIASDVDITHIDTGNDIIQQQSYHHNHEAILEQGLILKDVYYNDASINYNAQEEFQGVIETLYNLTMPMMRLTKLSFGSLVLLFTDDKTNDFYHIFPPTHNIISINDVNYNITKDRICAVLEKTDYIVQQLKYFSPVDDKEKEIGICVICK